MKTYALDDMFDAYLGAARPYFALKAFGDFERHRWLCLCRCFGVSFDDELCAVLEREAHLPHPLQGMLEAGITGRRFLPQLVALGEAEAALKKFYRQRARELAASRWGDLGTRTHEQLLAAGFDPSGEPNIDDYIDEL